jgi:peroxiredoxin
MIEEGKPAAMFTLPSETGEDVSLESFRGKPVVLYFHPRDHSLRPLNSVRPGNEVTS